MKSLKVTDGYKVYHIEQYPQQVSSMYGNLTPRGDKYFQRVFDKDSKYRNVSDTYVAFGMQQTMKEIVQYYKKTFFDVEEDRAVSDMIKTLENYIGADQVIIDALHKLHKKGYLPIIVKTVNEGDLVRMNQPCLTVETEDGFAWIMGYLEPIITNMMWKTITNATTAFEFFKIAKYYGDVTGTNEISMKFGFHDFSSRGQTGLEDASRNGVPHLLYFNGTESVGALGYIEDMYNYDYEKEGILAGSIRATEHSVSTTNIFFNIEQSKKFDVGGINFKEAEEQFFVEYITQIYPDGIVAYVADTFDFYGFLYDILPNYKDVINNRDGKVVIRPDSFSDPVYGILGTQEYPFFLTEEEAMEYANDNMEDSGDVLMLRVLDMVYIFSVDTEDNIKHSKFSLDPEHVGALPKLLKDFGFEYNDCGFAELNPNIGLIYGDGFNLERTNDLFDKMVGMGLASSNVVIGLGSVAYSWVSRDTLGIAYKATSFKYENEDGNEIDVDIFKDPKGSNKKSARGMFNAKRGENGIWDITDSSSREDSRQDDMKILFSDGNLNEVSFSDIRNNINHIVNLNLNI